MDGWVREFVEWVKEGLNEVGWMDTLKEGAIECRCKCLHSPTFYHHVIQIICQLKISKKFLRYKHHYLNFKHFQVRI